MGEEKQQETPISEQIKNYQSLRCLKAKWKKIISVMFLGKIKIIDYEMSVSLFEHLHYIRAADPTRNQPFKPLASEDEDFKDPSTL